MDLKKLGITDYGELESGELGNCANNKLELFFPDRVRFITHRKLAIMTAYELMNACTEFIDIHLRPDL